MLLNFTISSIDEIKADRLFRYVFLGGIISLIWTLAIIFWGVFYFKGEYTVPASNWYSFFYIFKVNRGLEVLAVLLFFAGIAIRHSRGRLIATIALATLVWLLSRYSYGSIFLREAWQFPIHVDSETVLFGLPIALIIYIAARKQQRFITDLVFASICFVLLTAPWLFRAWYEVAQKLSLPALRKFLTRAEIWDGVANKILESPVWGYGIDSIRYLEHVSVAHKYYEDIPLGHPHNMFLQIWLDTGFIGVLMMLGLIIISWKAIRNAPFSLCPSIVGGVVMLSLYSMITHSLWQTWSMSLISIFAILVTIALKTSSEE